MNIDKVKRRILCNAKRCEQYFQKRLKFQRSFLLKHYGDLPHVQNIRVQYTVDNDFYV